MTPFELQQKQKAKSIQDLTPFEISQIDSFQNRNRGFIDETDEDLENDYLIWEDWDMIAYTPDQIFDLLGCASCKTDVIEIEHYVHSNWEQYSMFDVWLFLQSINILNEVFRWKNISCRKISVRNGLGLWEARMKLNTIQAN